MATGFDWGNGRILIVNNSNDGRIQIDGHSGKGQITLQTLRGAYSSVGDPELPNWMDVITNGTASEWAFAHSQVGSGLENFFATFGANPSAPDPAERGSAMSALGFNINTICAVRFYLTMVLDYSGTVSAPSSGTYASLQFGGKTLSILDTDLVDQGGWYACTKLAHVNFDTAIYDYMFCVMDSIESIDGASAGDAYCDFAATARLEFEFYGHWGVSTI